MAKVLSNSTFLYNIGKYFDTYHFFLLSISLKIHSNNNLIDTEQAFRECWTTDRERHNYSYNFNVYLGPRWVGLVVSVSASHAVGGEFAL